MAGPADSQSAELVLGYKGPSSKDIDHNLAGPFLSLSQPTMPWNLQRGEPMSSAKWQQTLVHWIIESTKWLHGLFLEHVAPFGSSPASAFTPAARSDNSFMAANRNGGLWE